MNQAFQSRCIAAHRVEDLSVGWVFLRAEPGEFCKDNLPAVSDSRWQATVVPTTVASALDRDREAGLALDQFDWWFRLEIASAEFAAGEVVRLRLEGLASLSELWIDGEHRLTTQNMHRSYLVEMPERSRQPREILLRFSALASALAVRRTRPRWKTGLVTSQNLRWIRTTLLGRMASWEPKVDAIGPWRRVTLETARHLDLRELDVCARLDGERFLIRVNAGWRQLRAGAVLDAVLSVGADQYPIDNGLLHETGIEAHELEIHGVERWWPHTHGNSHLYPCRLTLRTASEVVVVDAGLLGFKEFRAIDDNKIVSLQCNGVQFFARGACWTVADVRRIDTDPVRLRRLLTLVRDAGMNMLRVLGTMVYESDAFYALCDELGILVWQDFMFANMDYPLDQPDFLAEAVAEVEEQLHRLHRHACIAVYCGGSEIEQQAAMMGLPREQWSHPFFAERIPALCRDIHPGAAYFASTPTGGELPFHTTSGICHYYGVGAYRRPITDARLAGVRFAAEALGFSNVPDPGAVMRMAEYPIAPHDPIWKLGVPRDYGVGWDFEDVRDHYFKEIVGIDPLPMRLDDPQRYLAYSRIVSGEVMSRVFSAWRSAGSGCQGALIWFLIDLAPGAGWGVIDVWHEPKPVWWYLKRCFSSRTALIEDRGLEGLDFHVLNDRPEPFHARLEIELWEAGRIRTHHVVRDFVAEAHASARFGTAALFGHFIDINHAYRFGPAAHQAVVARLSDADTGLELAEVFWFSRGLETGDISPKMEFVLAQQDDDFVLSMTSDQLLKGVSLESPGYFPSENFFHLVPQHTKHLHFKNRSGKPTVFRAHFSALNTSANFVVRENDSKAHA